MKVLRIRCHCGRNLADCLDHPAGRYAGGTGDDQADQLAAAAAVNPTYPSAMGAPEGHPKLIVLGRPGVGSRHHQPTGQVLTYTWTCPACGRTPSVRAYRIGNLYQQYRSVPRRVVYVAFGTEI